MSDAIIKQIPIGPMMNFAYLIGDDERAVCAAVDPGWDPMKIIKTAEECGWKIEKILLTHGHFDHSGAVEALAKATGVRVFVHSNEADEMPDGIGLDTTSDGTTIELGDLKIECIHTPGHTPGSQCFLVDGSILTGDALFVDNCGRVDLPESDPKKMLDSLRRLANLDPNIVVYPGHDYGPSKTTTIGEQRERNPYMSAKSEGMLLQQG